MDGGKQIVYKRKEDTISPTVSTYSIFLSFIINYKDNMRVNTCNLPGTFVQSYMD